MLAIVMDVARRPVFPDRELAKRRAEAITAVRQDEDNPAVHAVVGLSELLYGIESPLPPARERHHREPRAHPIGDAIAGFRTGQYVRPAVLTLAVVGDVGAQDVIDRTAAELDGWTGARGRSGRRAAPLVPPGPADAPDFHAGEVADRISRTRFTTISRSIPRYYASWMMNNILGQFGLGGSWPTTSANARGWRTTRSARSMPTSAKGRWWCVPASIPTNVDRALEAIDEEVRQLGAEGPDGRRGRRNARVPDRVNPAACSRPTTASRGSCRRAAVRPWARLRSGPARRSSRP